MLKRDDILGKVDFPVEQKEIKEWGGEVYVRGLSALDRDRLLSKFADEDYPQERYRVELVTACVCDAKGVRIFEDEDADALGQKSPTAIDQIFPIAQRLSGLDRETKEELEKN